MTDFSRSSPAASLVIRLEPSLRLAVILTLAHAAAIGLLWLLALPAWAKASASAILAASLVFHLRRYALLCSPRSITRLEVMEDMTFKLETRNGARLDCELLGSSFVAPYLTVLELKPAEPVNVWQRPASHTITILPDGINAEEFRQLRVLLRWKWKDSGKQKRKRKRD